MAISSLPLLIFLLFSRMLPESLMFLAITGQKDMVERQLNTVSENRHCQMRKTKLVAGWTCTW